MNELSAIKLEKDDILLINGQLLQKDVNKLRKEMKRLGMENNLIIVLPKGYTLESLDNKRMNKHGWYKEEDSDG